MHGLKPTEERRVKVGGLTKKACERLADAMQVFLRFEGLGPFQGRCQVSILA